MKGEQNKRSIARSVSGITVMAIGGMGLLAAIFGGAIAVDQVAQGTVAKDSRLVAMIGESRSAFLEARLYNKEFLLSKDEAYSDRSIELISDVSSQVEEVRALAADAGLSEAVAGIDELASQAASYGAGVARLRELNVERGLDPTLGLEGALRRSVHEFEEAINQMNDFEMKSKMLMMRRHEKDFMMRGQEKYVGRLNSRVEEFLAFEDTKYPSAELRERIESLLVAYQSSFHAYAKAYLAEAEHHSAMAGTFAASKPVYESLLRIVSDDLAATTSFSERARYGAFGVAALFTICGVAAFRRRARRLSSDMSGALDETRTAIQRLADGDLEVETPKSDYAELASLSSALETFKANAIDRARLEDEAKAAAEEREAEKKRQTLLDEQAKAKEEAAERAKLEEEARRREEDVKAAERARVEREEEEKARKSRMLAMVKSSIEEVVTAAVAGDLSRRIDGAALDEELRDVAVSINELIAKVDASLAETGAVLVKLSEGDLTERVHGEYEGVFLQMKETVNASLDNLTSLVRGISESSGSVSSGAGGIRSAADNLARRTESNAATLEETSAALEEFSKSVASVAGNVTDATRNADDVKKKAESIGAVTKAAADSIEDISAGSNEIEKVISVIEDISFQINLLSLNAGVEAARAGEAGRGFTVVASEVRALAQRSTEAVSSITEVIKGNRSAVEQGVEKMNTSIGALGEIVNAVVGISNQMSEVEQQVAEQAKGVTEITSAMTDLDRAVQENAAMCEEVNAGSDDLNSQAVVLNTAVRSFTVDEKGSSHASTSEGEPMRLAG